MLAPGRNPNVKPARSVALAKAGQAQSSKSKSVSLLLWTFGFCLPVGGQGFDLAFELWILDFSHIGEISQE